MKKTIFLLLAAVISVAAMAQADTTKKDTVVAYQYLDTIPTLLIYEGKKKKLRQAAGYMIRSGHAVPQGDRLQWVKQPETIGYLDHRKRPLRKVLRVY